MFRWIVAASGLTLTLLSVPASAQSASSSAYAVNANETVTTGLVNATVNVGPLAATSGAAAPNYSNNASVATVNQSASLIAGPLGATQNLQTGLLTSNSSGTSAASTGTGTINDLNLSIASNLTLANLLGVGATTIQSTSQANSIGGLDASGSTTIEGLTLYGLLLNGVSIDANLLVNPLPNTTLLNIAGLSIILNQQTMLGDGINNIGISTNAINIGFNNFALGTGILNGNLILGHSEAFASVGTAGAVPEPATWAMMLLGFAAIGIAVRRSKPAMQLQRA